MQLKYFLAASAASVSLACGLAAVPAAAQQITTGIEGSVTDESGNPVVGATVTVTDTRTGSVRTLTTGANGTFNTSGLTTGGPYEVTATADGLEGQTVSGIQTSLQGNTNLAFSLSSGGGVITVTGSRVRVTQLAVGPGESFSAEVMRSAPSFNRDIRDIIRLDPRVSLDREDPASGGKGQDLISCLGGNNRGNTFTVDGISQADVYGLNDVPFSSRSSSPIPFDAVRETQVQFAPFDVEYGQFSGCAINVVTESGTNSFHGGGFFEYSDSSLRADTLLGSPVPPIEPEKRWGVSIGGPIANDRLFFFFAYEHHESGQAQDDGPAGAGFTNSIAAVPVAAFNEISDVLSNQYGIETGPLVYSRPYKNDRYFGRIDYQVNDDHRLELTYQHVDETSITPDDFNATGTSIRVTGLNTFQNSGSLSDYYSARLYSQWTDRLSTEIRFSRSDVVDNQGPVGGGEAQDANPIPRIIVGVDNATGADGQVLAGPGFSRSANDLRYNSTLLRAVAKYDAGNHQFKFGGEVNDLDLYNLFIQNGTSTLYFANVADLRAGILRPTQANNTNPNTTQLTTGQTVGAHGNFSATGDPLDAGASLKRQIYSLFAQDDWQINDRLSAVIGVRVDMYDGNGPNENPLFEQRYGFANTTGFSDIGAVVQPRVALTYEADDFSVFSRPTFRAGFGVFGGGDPGVWFGNTFQNNGITFAEGKLTSAACAKNPDGTVNVLTGGTFTVPDCFKADGVASAAQGRGDPQAIDPNIKAPTVLRFNAGFQTGIDFAPTGILSGWNLALDFIYSKYEDPLTYVDLSQTPDIRLGVNGFSIDGRPLYRPLDPLQAGCNVTFTGLDGLTPTYSGLTTANAAACFGAALDDAFLLTNGRGYDSAVASVAIGKRFDRGLFTDGGFVDFNFGFAYTDSKDRRNMYSSTAGSSFDGLASFDMQDPALSRGFYNSKFNYTGRLNFTEQFFGELDTQLGLTFVARSGRPYSLTFTGQGLVDTAQAFDSALIYIPTGITDPNIAPTSNMAAVQALVDFSNTLPCAKKFAGRTVDRNSCSQPWYYDMDLTFSQELPGPGSFLGLADDKIKLYGTIDNFLNLLDGGWNLHKRRNFTGWSDLAQAGRPAGGGLPLIQAVDSQGRYVITNADGIAPSGTTGLSPFQTDETLVTSGSIWRLKVGISYAF